MDIECACGECEYCFEGDCMLREVRLDENRVCRSFVPKKKPQNET